MDKKQISNVRFEWLTDEQPVFDVGWQPKVLREPAGALWRVSATGPLAEIRPYLEQRRQMAAAWERYAEEVAHLVQHPQDEITERDEAMFVGASDDIEARLMGYAERLLGTPFVVESIWNGELLARTRIVWERGELRTTWYVAEAAPEMGALHNVAVEVAGRALLALAQRESTVGLALQRVPEPPGTDRNTIKSHLLYQAESISTPALAPLMAIPSSVVLTPYIVTRQGMLDIDWCWVPNGPFTMGGERNDREKPVHEVNVDGYWMMRYPVTNAQYRQFVDAGGYAEQRWWTDAGWRAREEKGWTEPRYWQDSKWNEARQPVVGVSWYEAAAFCRWASEASGRAVRLPTEAEWEKAARGTDGQEYPWGNAAPTAELCNFERNVGQTTPVGQYSPAGDSPYGCTDMSGNVREWCVSEYRGYPYADDGRNELTSTGSRVLRGGSWFNYWSGVRAAYRNGSTPGDGFDVVGFRCASTPF